MEIGIAGCLKVVTSYPRSILKTIFNLMRDHYTQKTEGVFFLHVLVLHHHQGEFMCPLSHWLLPFFFLMFTYLGVS